LAQQVRAAFKVFRGLPAQRELPVPRVRLGQPGQPGLWAPRARLAIKAQSALLAFRARLAFRVQLALRAALRGRQAHRVLRVPLDRERPL
jgi:UDP:flavonoid glycosyltransferase YjiC (YdhE family)